MAETESRRRTVVEDFRDDFRKERPGVPFPFFAATVGHKALRQGTDFQPDTSPPFPHFEMSKFHTESFG